MGPFGCCMTRFSTYKQNWVPHIATIVPKVNTKEGRKNIGGSGLNGSLGMGLAIHIIGPS